MTAGRLLDLTEPQLLAAVTVLALASVGLCALGNHLSRTTPTS